MKNREWLSLYVVYQNPKDYPDDWVVRRFLVCSGSTPGAQLMDAKPWALCGCLAQARETIPEWCVRLDRHPADDPAIAEVWL
jgi:hypothetical protein